MTTADRSKIHEALGFARREISKVLSRLDPLVVHCAHCGKPKFKRPHHKTAVEILRSAEQKIGNVEKLLVENAREFDVTIDD